jgi:predicted ATPase
MLEEFQITNLGCLDENISPVSINAETVLIGPNNSGKSTFIAGINMLRYIFLTHSVNFSNTLYNLHDWKEAIHNHELAREINISAILDSIRYEVYIRRGGIRMTKTSIGNLGDNKTKVPMKKIWYLNPNRSLIPYDSMVGMSRDGLQPQLSPSGHDVIQFLLEKYTERHPNWDMAEEWSKKIDPEISSIRTPIRGKQAFFESLLSKLSLNASLHGSGFQSIASIISAVVFSPENSILIIEEPEIHLHKKSQETLVDLFNFAVNSQNKQIIFSTHSWDMLLPFISDVGRGAKRGKQHIHADPTKFRLLAFNKVKGHVTIEPIDLSKMKVSDVKKYLKKLWG